MVALEDEANVFLVQLRTLLAVHFVYGFASKVVFPRPLIVEHPKDAHECGFARARGAHDGHKLALPYVEVDPPQQPDRSCRRLDRFLYTA